MRVIGTRLSRKEAEERLNKGIEKNIKESYNGNGIQIPTFMQNNAHKEVKGLDELKKMVTDFDIKKATHSEVIELGEKVNAVLDISTKVGNPDEIKKALSLVRDIGFDLSDSTFSEYSNIKVVDEIKEVFQHLPKTWAENFINTGKQIYASKDKSSFFYEEAVRITGELNEELLKNSMRYITISNPNGIGAAYHEIGHLIENVDSDILDKIQSFREYRTKNEELELLNKILPNIKLEDKVFVKKDNFITPYIGRYYEDGSTEVLSTGIEGLFSGRKFEYKWQENFDKKGYIRKDIKSDEEYLHFIIGILVGG